MFAWWTSNYILTFFYLNILECVHWICQILPQHRQILAVQIMYAHWHNGNILNGMSFSFMQFLHITGKLCHNLSKEPCRDIANSAPVWTLFNKWWSKISKLIKLLSQLGIKINAQSCKIRNTCAGHIFLEKNTYLCKAVDNSTCSSDTCSENMWQKEVDSTALHATSLADTYGTQSSD